MNAASSTIRLRYWGVTGSFANPLPPEWVERKLVRALGQLCRSDRFIERLSEFARDSDALARFVEHHVAFADRSTFGGNTTCLEIETPRSLVIVDAGSGLRRLGEDLARRWNDASYSGDRSAHVLLTHAHMDHTFATPFFDPYYDKRNSFHVWGSEKVMRSLNAVLSPSSALRSTYFPLTFELMDGLDRFTTITDHEDFTIEEEIRVRTLPLNHPGGCMAYRLDVGGRGIVVATDHEPTESPDAALISFCRDAELLYIDAQYTRAEYEGRKGIAEEPPLERRGWGHGTIESAIDTALAANARRVRIGHHEPRRTDERLLEMESYARSLLSAELARRDLPPDHCDVALAREGASDWV